MGDLKKRILFVDDDAAVLDGLRVQLRKQRHRWDMVFAPSGEAALSEMGRAAFDVIISDMRMPGMDGAEFLRRTKYECPGAIRIVLSGYAEREAIARSALVATQFLAKPCDPETLCHVIERACDLQSIVQDENLRRIVGSLDKLPSVPDLYWQLCEAIADPQTSVGAVAAIAERDPAMCTKLLQLVNSAFFGLVEPVTAVPKAVAYLGLDLVKTFALTAKVFAAADGGSSRLMTALQRVQRDSLLVGRVASRLIESKHTRQHDLPAERASSVGAEEALSAGVVHDVGEIIIGICLPDKAAEIEKSAGNDRRRMLTVERELFGATHAEIGAYLLGTWGLPLTLVESTAHHHDLPAVAGQPFGTAAAVSIADALVQGIHLSDAEFLSSGPLDRGALAQLGVDESTLLSWRAMTARFVQEGRA